MATTLRVLEIRLGGRVVGHLGNAGGQNVFVAAPEYIFDPTRPTLSLAFVGDGEEQTRDLLGRYPSEFTASSTKLPPFFANLLPEGALRARITAQLKVSDDQEFDILAVLGRDLPGAVEAFVVDRAPLALLAHFEGKGAIEVSARIGKTSEKFSLAGVQLKFSVFQDIGKRYTLARETEVGSIIAKLPHPGRVLLPENEFSSMELARLAGVDTPAFWLDDVARLDIEGIEGLVGHFFAIQRFDRGAAGRIHIEDFAQVLNIRPANKYGSTNYDTIARIILSRTGSGMENLLELIRRLVVNLLMGNGDAHLKNFSLIYRDGRTPELAPAYDIVSTIQYLPTDLEMGLNLSGERRSAELRLEHFERLAHRLGLPVPTTLTQEVRLTVERARERWPEALKSLPMEEGHKSVILSRLETLPIAGT